MHNSGLKFPFSTALVLAITALGSGGLSAQGLSGADSSLDYSTGQQRPLPVEQAFPWFVSATDEGYEVLWTPAPGHYLYRHAFVFGLVEPEDAEPLSLTAFLPEGITRADAFFGEVEAYYEQVTAVLHLPNSAAPRTSLLIEYQGCADWGFCYPPQRVVYPLPTVSSGKLKAVSSGKLRAVSFGKLKAPSSRKLKALSH